MIMSDFAKQIEDLGQRAKDYADLQITDVKLRTVKGLSTALGKLVYIQVLVLVMAVFLIALAVGLVFLLGDLVGSTTVAAFIVVGIFLIALIVLLLLRKKLFRNTFVPLFVKLFFEGGDGELNFTECLPIQATSYISISVKPGISVKLFTRKPHH